MWAGNAAANSFESTIVWSDGTTTYYFPSGFANPTVTPAILAPVFDKADDVLSVFSSFGWGKVVPDPTSPDGKKWEFKANVLDANGSVIDPKFQWPTYYGLKPTSINLYQ